MRYIFSVLLLLLSASVGLAQGKARAVLSDSLPAPHATKSSMNFSHVIGWKEGETPKAPEGFTVVRYADGFDNPRWLYTTPNGDILVAESNSNHPFLERIGAHIIGASKSNSLRHSADRITLLRDVDGDGKPEIRKVFLKDLNQPFGMLILGDWFYVANTDGLWRYPYTSGQLSITGKGEKLVDLPAGKANRHWTRNLLASKDGSRIYIAVGSGSNIAEKGIANEFLRAAILELKPDGTGLRVYASGLRNPVGMDWAPGTNTLWTVVNERDELGDDLVPDYLTHVQENGFYGWPWMYHGRFDDRVTAPRPAVVASYITPDVDLGSHTASLGLTFYDKQSFPQRYHNGVFIAQHGSWNRSTLSGYKVIFVPFKEGRPVNKGEDFLTGFIAELGKEKVRGRPVCVMVAPDGSLLVTDDVSNVIWKITAGR
ncbi:MAG TPA: sorbosone dehydrogenase family protein [Ohtaekwangia sp.]|uniref:PQQ-dependent sugar dehydrogenase n=1 Tax=Ohtaekwangia sp. TaxID=2066019 RepID=UPI002F929F03